MIALKCIRTFTPTKHGFFHKTGPAKRKNSILLLSKTNDSDSTSPAPEGDTQKQEMLAKIAMLQTQKVRLTDYLDERSSYLSQFAEEANAEIEQIGEDALKELDQTSARIMENIENQMQEYEESSELNKLEIEKNEEELAKFEDQIKENRNEGMFFKNLGEKAPVDKEKAMVETKIIKEIVKQSAGQKTRRNIYLALISLLTIGIVDSISSSDYRKTLVLGALLIGILLQVIYEQSVSSETEKTQEEDTMEDKE